MNKKKNIFAISDCPSPEVLQAYLNNELSKEKKHLVEEHLIECEMCSDELEGLSCMIDTEKLPEIIDDIQEELGISEVKRIRIKPIYQLAAAIAVVFIVAGSIFLTEYLSESGTIDMVSQAVEKIEKEETPPAIEKSLEKVNMENALEEKSIEEKSIEEKSSPAKESGKVIKKSEEADKIDAEISEEGSGITDDANEVVFRGESKKDMVLEEVSAQKSSTSFAKSSKPIGQNYTLSSSPAVDSALIYYNLKQHDKAINYLKSILKYDEENEKALYELALNYYEIEDYKKSLKYISKLLDLGSNIYQDECVLLLHSIIEKSAKYKSRAEKMLDSIR